MTEEPVVLGKAEGIRLVQVGEGKASGLLVAVIQYLKGNPKTHQAFPWHMGGKETTGIG